MQPSGWQTMFYILKYHWKPAKWTEILNLYEGNDMEFTWNA